MLRYLAFVCALALLDSGSAAQATACNPELLGSEIQNWAQEATEEIKAELLNHHERSETDQIAYVIRRFGTLVNFRYNVELGNHRPPQEGTRRALLFILTASNQNYAGCFPPLSSLLGVAAQQWRNLENNMREQQEARKTHMQRQREQFADQSRAGGYEGISIETFVLDGNDLAEKAAKIMIQGVYVREGNLDVLYADAQAIFMAKQARLNPPKVPLLADDATRELRRYLLSCQSNPAAQMGCPLMVLGRATRCTLTNAFGSTRETFCVVVDDGQQMSGLDF